MTTTAGLRYKHWLSLLQDRTSIQSLRGTFSVLHTPTEFTEFPASCRLALMSYYGVVLLLSGYQADETHILKQYKAIVEKLAGRYPLGSLWILNRVNISSVFPCGRLNITPGKDLANVVRRRRCDPGITGWIEIGQEEQVQAG